MRFLKIFLQNEEQDQEEPTRNVWAFMVINLLSTLCLGLIILGFFRLNLYLSPLTRNNHFDFSYIASLLLFQFATAIAALFFGRNLAKRKAQNWKSAFVLGAIWGATAQIIVSLLSVFLWYYPFKWRRDWAEKCITDFLIFTFVVGVLVLTGFALRKRNLRLCLICLAFLCWVFWLYFRYYQILF